MSDRMKLEEAQQLLFRYVKKIEDAESVNLLDARGRVLAETIAAERNQPPFDRSPLDGYAVRSADIMKASKEHPAVLTVIEEVTAGDAPTREVNSGQACRIMTGAQIPTGADCVIRQEDTDYGETQVQIFAPVNAYQNYCFSGEDFKAGEILLKAGTLLGAAEIGVLASCGKNTVQVFRRVRAAVICTGDELLMPGEKWKHGKIYDSNLYMQAARLAEWNVETVFCSKAPDRAEAVAEMIRTAESQADIVITTGGVSVGKKDIMHEVLKLLGAERLFWKIAMKPGMPTLCAYDQGKLLICLSGNPYGAAVGMELLVRPLIAEMSSREDLRLKRCHAVLRGTFEKHSRVSRYLRAIYDRDSETVRLSGETNASGVISSYVGCNCFIEIPPGSQGIYEGDMVAVVLR